VFVDQLKSLPARLIPPGMVAAPALTCA